MAYRAFLIPLRNDFAGMGVQVLDLSPNSSQKNNSIDGAGQTYYLGPCLEVAGATKVNDDAYVSGPRNTALTVNPVLDDTTGGGNDCYATHTATFGLAAYIRERVQPGGIGLATHAPATFAQANSMAAAVFALVQTGVVEDITAVNSALSNVVAQTDLDGATATSRSFGTMEDILQIISGAVYRSPRYVIIANAAAQFLTKASRDALVALQNVAANGGTTFKSTGAYLTSTEHGYQQIPMTALSEQFYISAMAGRISHLMGNMTFKNPAFAYTAADVTAWKPRAYYLNGAGTRVVIPATGVAPGVHISLLS